MAIPNDTSPEAERILIGVYRKMPMGKKWLLLGEDYRTARVLHAAGARLRNPKLTPHQINQEWMALNLGFVPPDSCKEVVVVQGPTENLRVVREAIAILDRLGIAYALGGSMASSLYGKDRETKDADIMVEPFAGKETLLAGSFGSDYYVSQPAIAAALEQRSSFNIISLSTGFKLDFFVRKDRPFDVTALNRRQPVHFPDSPDSPVVVVSPEDLILLKLEWYRIGGEVSEQQLRDVISVMNVQAGSLDNVYLDHWANELKVKDLLDRARHERSDEAGPPLPT
jgi:hypothetical protein